MRDLILVGDRVLIDPDLGERQTNSGLYLPATVVEQNKVLEGRVVNVGPGYLMANPEYTEGEPWAVQREAVRYLPLQAQIGDTAFFLRKESIEINHDGKRYLIIPHNAILALHRQHLEDRIEGIDGLDELFD